MKIAVARRIPDAGLELLQQAGDVKLWDGELPMSTPQLIELAQGADGLLSLLTDPITPEVLDRLPTLRVVSNFAVGFDNIDVPACTERGVAVCITPDVLTDTTADFAFALLMALARRIPESAEASKAGAWKTWEPLGFLGREVHGATIGIVGLGRIGAAVAKRAHGFNMRILYVEQEDRAEVETETGAERRELDDLLRESDFVSLHVPLTAETRGLIGARELDLMKPTAALINTARGPVVQTEALADALESGAIWGAALDVTDPEPLPASHRLYSIPNALITPHIASGTEDTRNRMAELAAQNLLAVLRNQTPPRCLNPEVLSRGRG